ncbi:hypothetical protein [Faecalibacter rhinopitheci]|uniref:Uncharacterized protein n=1 Tax=Faecalibacter rhinopitheci TaxID=2779678 RepID=A0A8J7G837_9FLAO|nr:hypothetical protein [Faecalibacter rhinopitheci]MBF0596990.1 hypothetical protein [Faecalibacter rhinopitheci]
MKNRIILVLILAFLSLLSGILISKMSFIGKVGITFFYDEYTIFKSWWKTGLLFFVIQMIIFGLLSFFHFENNSVFKQKIVPIIFIIIGVIGVYYTYYDFTETSHRLMKTSFHMGFYLFWIGWFISCIYYLILTKKEIEMHDFDTLYKHESQE